jgi:phosphoenolpyruvate-protein kinase (PTS system EI component)
MAAESADAGILMGMGLGEFSTPAMAIPRLKHVIRHWRYEDAVKLAEQAMDCTTVQDVEALVTAHQPEVDMHPLALKPSAPGCA